VREAVLFNCGIHALTMEESVSAVEGFVSEKGMRRAVFLNAGKFAGMEKNPALAEAVRKADLRLADGQSVVWACRFLGQPVPERVAGIDLMGRVLEVGAKKGFSFFFLGAREGVVKKTVDACKEKYPGIRVAGYRNGYFSPEEEDGVAETIRGSGADILFVAITSPRKELFVEKYLAKMRVPFAMGVGGSFDVVAGVTVRAPVFMQKMGLEWFFRFLQEPRKLWRRYLFGNVFFILKTFKYRLARGRGK